MPRKPRVEYEGAAYHVMCRGDRQEAFFRGDTDRERFLETLWECGARLVDLAKTPLETYPWSSYPDYLGWGGGRRGPIAVDRVLGELGLADDRAGRREYAAYVKGLSAAMLTERGRKDLEKEWKEIRGLTPFGAPFGTLTPFGPFWASLFSSHFGGHRQPRPGRDGEA